MIFQIDNAKLFLVSIENGKLLAIRNSFSSNWDFKDDLKFLSELGIQISSHFTLHHNLQSGVYHLTIDDDIGKENDIDKLLGRGFCEKDLAEILFSWSKEQLVSECHFLFRTKFMSANQIPEISQILSTGLDSSDESKKVTDLLDTMLKDTIDEYFEVPKDRETMYRIIKGLVYHSMIDMVLHSYTSIGSLTSSKYLAKHTVYQDLEVN